jgi:hypothetical protein
MQHGSCSFWLFFVMSRSCSIARPIGRLTRETRRDALVRSGPQRNWLTHPCPLRCAGKLQLPDWLNATLDPCLLFASLHPGCVTLPREGGVSTYLGEQLHHPLLSGTVTCSLRVTT